MKLQGSHIGQFYLFQGILYFHQRMLSRSASRSTRCHRDSTICGRCINTNNQFDLLAQENLAPYIPQPYISCPAIISSSSSTARFVIKIHLATKGGTTVLPTASFPSWLILVTCQHMECLKSQYVIL